MDMFLLSFILAMPLGFGAGACINYIVFKGIEVYSKNPNQAQLRTKRDNFLYAFLFGAGFVLVALLTREAGINTMSIFQSIGCNDVVIALLPLLLLGSLIIKRVKKKKKREYLSQSLYMIFFITILFLLISQPW